MGKKRKCQGGCRMVNKDRKIKQLDIVFENCESCTLTPDMIYMCTLDRIYNNIGINCFQYRNGEIYDEIFCDQFMLVINQKGLQQKSGFGDFRNDDTLEKRLKYRDITHIDLIYDDNTNDYISVHWEDDNNEYTNKLQNNLYQNCEGEECMVVIINKTPLTLKELEDNYGIY